jgi:hypothetical protein
MTQEKVATIESLAQTLTDFRSEVVTQLADLDVRLTEKIDVVRNELMGEVVGVRDDVRQRPTHTDLRDELEKYRYAKEIDVVSKRVGVCEEKLGIERPLELELGL